MFAKKFDRQLLSDALVSGLEEKAGARALLLQVMPIKGIVAKNQKDGKQEQTSGRLLVFIGYWVFIRDVGRRISRLRGTETPLSQNNVKETFMQKGTEF